MVRGARPDRLRERAAHRPQARENRGGLWQAVPVHVKIHTGMSRYGVRWDEALPLIEKIVAEKSLLLEGVMSHFSQSDETDKTFANLQFARFNEVLHALEQRKISVKLRHTCNSGGFLDLPHAHLDMVRAGHFALRRFSVTGLPEN